MRIVSLLPSATEIVCALGLKDNLVGRSHSCDFPAGIEHLPVLTQTTVPKHASSAEIDAHVRRYLGSHSALYQLDLDALEAVQPDIIVSQRLCDVCAVSSNEIDSALAGISSRPRLIDLEPASMDDVFADLLRVGEAAGVGRHAGTVVDALRDQVLQVGRISDGIVEQDRPRVAMLEWLDPPFNSGHWNPELVKLAGAVDCIGPIHQPSRTVTWDQVQESTPDMVLLACCGFDIERTRRELTLLPDHSGWHALYEQVEGRVLVTDGDAYFSRPGPRLVEALRALAHALHPHVHPPVAGVDMAWLGE